MNTATLGGQMAAWWTLGERRAQVQAARQKAIDRVTSLEWEHKMLEAMVDQKPAPSAADPSDDSAPEEDNAALVARLRSLTDQRKTLMELDRRIQDTPADRRYVQELDRRPGCAAGRSAALAARIAGVGVRNSVGRGGGGNRSPSRLSRTKGPATDVPAALSGVLAVRLAAGLRFC